MDNIKINTTVINSLYSLPIMFLSVMGNPSYEISYLHTFSHPIERQTTDIFNELPKAEIVMEENKMETLLSFVTNVVKESKDLDSEIVEMVNNNFEKLLLKI